MRTKNTSIPPKVKTLARQFKRLGKVTIEPGFDKTHWKIMIGGGGNMNVSDLFITLVQNGVHRFTPIAFGKIYINIHTDKL